MEEARGEHRTHEVLFCTNCHAADSGHSDGSMQNRELTQQPTDREEERAGKGKAGCSHLVMELGSQPQAPWEVRPCRKPLFAASWRREMCSGRGDLHAFPPFWPSLWVPYGTEQKLQESKTQPWESHGPSLGGKSCTTWDQYSVCNTGEGAPAWMDPLDSECIVCIVGSTLEKRGVGMWFPGNRDILPFAFYQDWNRPIKARLQDVQITSNVFLPWGQLVVSTSPKNPFS